MKRIVIFLAFSLSQSLIFVNAQETYINDRLTATEDVNGSSRYVGMGGALGALGADLSVISSNPAGMGLYRKSDVGITFGAVVPKNANGWSRNDSRTYNERLARPSFDQLGFVWSMKVTNSPIKFVNFSVNYQKKINYNHGFYADYANLGGLSQMDQVVELANGYDGNNNGLIDKGESYATDWNLAGLAADNNYLQQAPGTNQHYYNTFRGESSTYTEHQRGSMQSFDMNIAFNVKDRFYAGATFGVDNVKYQQWNEYVEYNEDLTNPGTYGDYALYNDREITGSGLNAKLGIIVRPVEDNSFRFGITMESPTRYRLRSSTLFDLTDLTQNPTVRSQNNKPTNIETVVRTPWRGRFSMGSTVDKYFAWGLEYEFANTAKTLMGYPTWDDPGYQKYSNSKDRAMNEHTKNVMRAQHTVKAGIEVKPDDDFAIRLGYNFVSSRYKKNHDYDQYMLHDSEATDFLTSTEYMTLGATNILTCGLGYKHKRFYADLAYKFRMQKASFYPFDTNFTSSNEFATANPTIAGATLEPVNVDLNRHNVQLTLGFKF